MTARSRSIPSAPARWTRILRSFAHAVRLGLVVVCALGVLATGVVASPAIARAGSSGDTRVAQLVEALGASDARTRNEAYATLLRERPPEALPLLVEALPRMELSGQNLGLSLVQVYPSESAQPILRRLLQSRAPLLELGAAAVFVRAGESDALEHVVKPLTKPGLGPEMLVAMIPRLYGLRDAPITDAVRALVASTTPTNVLSEALYHLAVVEDPATRARAAEILAQPALDPASRAVCAAYRLSTGDESQSSTLAREVTQGGFASLSRLSRFLSRAPSLGDELLAALAKLAETSPQTATVTTAISLLARHAGAREIRTLETLVGHADAAVSKAALEALQRRGVSFPHEPLVASLASPDAARALAAAQALLRADDDRGYARVKALATADGPQRVEAVRTLAQYRRREVVPLLIDALEHADLNVRITADAGLRTLVTNLFPYRRFDVGTTGYAPAGAPAARAAGVAVWRAWWTSVASR